MKMRDFYYQRVMISDFYSHVSQDRTGFLEHGTSVGTGGTNELKVNLIDYGLDKGDIYMR